MVSSFSWYEYTRKWRWLTAGTNSRVSHDRLPPVQGWSHDWAHTKFNTCRNQREDRLFRRHLCSIRGTTAGCGIVSSDSAELFVTNTHSSLATMQSSFGYGILTMKRGCFTITMKWYASWLLTRSGMTRCRLARRKRKIRQARRHTA